MVCGAAGSRVQVRSGVAAGRLVWAGHNKNAVCVWYSDDGGETYATSASFEGNEISIAQLEAPRVREHGRGRGGAAAAEPQLVMNGRGGDFRPGSRAEWHSADSGATWSAPSTNTTLGDVNCEGEFKLNLISCYR